MRSIDDDLKDLLMHRGVKGMRWGYNDGERNGKRVAGDEEEEKSPEEQMRESQENLKKIAAELEESRSKIGDGPLDTLRYILTGEKKKSSDSSKNKESISDEDLRKIDKSLKEMKGKVGDGPLDTLKYIVTGNPKTDIKKKVKDIPKEMSKRGERLLIKIFGEAKNTKTITTDYYNPTTGKSKTITRTLKR